MSRSPEHNPPPTEAKEAREPKVDFDWEKHVKAEWDKTKSSRHELKNLFIEGSKGSVDVLKLINPKKIFLKYTGETSGEVMKNHDIIINKFDNLIDLACLMHEGGHVQQKEEWADINKDLPNKFKERDATARALKWLREISNKTGIDFFKKFKVEKSWQELGVGGLELLDNCQNSIQEGMSNPDKFKEITVTQFLNDCLDAYKAKSLTDTYDPAKTGKRIKPKLKK